MCHEVIPKNLFVPFGDIIIIFRPFALTPISNGDRDVISNHNSALLSKYIGSLLGFLRFARRRYDVQFIMRRCGQLFCRASFGRFARCGGSLREETLLNLYMYNSSNASTNRRTSYICIPRRLLIYHRSYRLLHHRSRQLHAHFGRPPFHLIRLDQHLGRRGSYSRELLHVLGLCGLD